MNESNRRSCRRLQLKLSQYRWHFVLYGFIIITFFGLFYPKQAKLMYVFRNRQGESESITFDFEPTTMETPFTRYPDLQEQGNPAPQELDRPVPHYEQGNPAPQELDRPVPHVLRAHAPQDQGRPAPQELPTAEAQALQEVNNNRPSVWKVLRENSCQPETNIAYAKVHKTGSSAIQALFLRYGIKHNLTFALPKATHFPMHIPFDRKMIHSPVMTDGVEINIFTIHCQWNLIEIKKLMPANTLFIASVREPTEVFRSIFTYEAVDRRTGLDIDTFVKEVRMDSPRVVGIIGYNQMLFDLGLSTQDIMDENKVKQMIGVFDKYFDFVLVNEKMEESLVLLRHLLCWSIEDMATFKINAMTEAFRVKNTLTKLTEIRLRRLLQPDTLLYNHFKAKLEATIRAFGEERMEKEVQELRIATEDIRLRCKIEVVGIEKLTGPQRPMSYAAMGLAGRTDIEECRLFTYIENYLIDMARKKQTKDQ